jgi:hypothetical protein
MDSLGSKGYHMYGGAVELNTRLFVKCLWWNICLKLNYYNMVIFGIISCAHSMSNAGHISSNVV